MTRWTNGLYAIAATALLLSACGGDGTGDGGDRLTRAAFVRQGNTICDDINEDVDEVFAELFGEDFSHRPTPAELHDALTEAVTVLDAGLDDIAALEPPEAMEGEVEDMLSSARRAVAKLEDWDQRAAEGDEDVIDELVAGDPFAQADEKARRIGLTRCAEEDGEGEGDGEGDHGEGGPTDAERAAFSPEKRAFISEADAVCRENNKKFEEIAGQLFVPGGPRVDRAAKVLAPVIALVRDTNSRLRGMEPPAAEREAIVSLLDKFDAALAKVEQSVQVAAGGDQDDFSAALRDAFTAFDEANAQARQYGFVDCAQ